MFVSLALSLALSLPLLLYLCLCLYIYTYTHTHTQTYKHICHICLSLFSLASDKDLRHQGIFKECVCVWAGNYTPNDTWLYLGNCTPENFQFLLFFLYSFPPIEFFTLKQLLSVLLFSVLFIDLSHPHWKKYYKGREHRQFSSLMCLNELKPLKTMPNSWWMLNKYFLRLCSSKIIIIRIKIMIIISMTKNNCHHYLHI